MLLDNTQLRNIKALVCDVDGVITDGSIIYGIADEEMKIFDVKDGLAMKLAGWNNLPIIWLTGRLSEAVVRRAKELDVQVMQGVLHKADGLRAIAEKLNISLSEIAYLADDLNDLPALLIAGYPIAVNDAVPEVIAQAIYVTQASGGKGAVREVVELIFRAQQRWETAIETYLAHITGSTISFTAQ